MKYKEMMYHADFMIKELIRVSLMSLIKENKISVNNNSYNEKDVQAWMSKVKSDFNIMVMRDYSIILII